MIKNILNLGDAAVYCDFGKGVNPPNALSYHETMFPSHENGSFELRLASTPAWGSPIPGEV